MKHCTLLLLLCCGMLRTYAQDDRARLMRGFPADHVYGPRDTATILDMLNLAWSCVSKAGEEKIDIDSAQHLGKLAMTYSKKIGFIRGERIAGATLAQAAYEGRDVVELVRFSNYIKQPDRVWYMRNMVFLVASGDARNSPDSVLRWCQLTKQAAVEAKDAMVANEAEYYIGWAYYRMGKQRECKQAFLNMINYHSRRNDPEAQLEAWYELSRIVDDADTSYPSAIETAEKVLAFSKITGHMSYVTDAYFRAGYGYYVRGNIEKSQAILLEAEEVLFRVDVKGRRFVYELLTKIYSVKGDGAKALHYAEATLDHVRRYDNTPENIRLYSIRLSEVFLHFGKTNEYEATLRSVRVASPPEKATDWFYIIMLGQIMRRTNPQEAIDYLLERKKNVPINDLIREVELNREIGLNYNLLQNYPASLSYLSEAERLMKGLDIRFHGTFADVWINMAKSSFFNGQWDNAEKYVAKVESVPKGVVPINTQLYAEFLRFKIDSARMQYLSAIRHYTRHKTLNDSIASVQKMNELEVLNVRYQTAQKEHQLAQNAQHIAFLHRARTLSDELLRKTQDSAQQAKVLQDQRLYIVGNESRQRADSLRHAEETNRLLNTEAALNKDLLAQADSRRNWMIAGGVLLALLLLVTYSRYILKQRSNRQLEQQQALITSKNDALQKLVHEKEWLLKEVHHRVKNNLQVVMSLLNIQSHYLEDDTAISAIRNSQHRVNAISLIHKKLYQSDNPAMVHMPHYIKELADQLSDYSEQRHDINMVLAIEPIVLDISKALPIGLILNEAITNAFKYAFPDGRRGTIAVQLTQPTPDEVQLTIADNGIGMPDAQARAEGNSLGMSLMKGLSVDMDGDFYINGEEGTEITVTVKLDGQASSG